MKKPKNPFEDVLNQIADLMQLVEDNKSVTPKGKLPDDIEKNLDAIENLVAKFKDVTDEMLKQARVAPEEIAQNLKHPENLGKEEQKLLKRAQKLKEEVETNKRLYSREENIIKRKEKDLGKGKGAKKQIRARRKKFKGIGGKDNWTPV